MSSTPKKNINGILLLDKSAGMTSNGALQRVKRLFNAKKAGHTGSLDPIATGMLPICFGEATKFSQFLLDSNKAYQVVAKCGEQTTTGDSEGKVLQTRPVVDVTELRLQNILANMEGEMEQIPPMFSAIKHAGTPLYELARKGIEVERKARKVTIFSLELVAINSYQENANAVQTFTINVHCSKGTYVRTLVEAIGEELGCGAHVIELRRTKVSAYGDAAVIYNLKTLEMMQEALGPQGLLACLLPVETAVHHFPAIKLSTAAAFYLRMGQPVRAPVQPLPHLMQTQTHAQAAQPTFYANFANANGSSLVRLFAEDTTFMGMGEVMADGRLKPHRLLAVA